MANIEARLTEIFRTTFGDEGLVLVDEMTADDIAAWNSVTHIQLVFAVEEEFGIKLSMRDLEALENVGALRATVLHHLGQAVR